MKAQQRLYALLQSLQEEIAAAAGARADSLAELMRRQQQVGLALALALTRTLLSGGGSQ